MSTFFRKSQAGRYVLTLTEHTDFLRTPTGLFYERISCFLALLCACHPLHRIKGSYLQTHFRGLNVHCKTATFEISKPCIKKRNVYKTLKYCVNS
jgi:hypothetical protein